MPMPMEEQLKGGRERGGDENHDDVRECEETSHLHAVRRLLLQCAALPPPARDAEPVEVAVPPPSVSWLMGVSGDAFAYFYHPWGSCFSCFVSHRGHDPTVAALRASGLRGSWAWQRTPSAGQGGCVGTAQAALRLAAEALRLGYMVLAPGVVSAAAEPTNSQCGRFFVVREVDPEAMLVWTQPVVMARPHLQLEAASCAALSPHSVAPCGWRGRTRAVVGDMNSLWGPLAHQGGSPLLLVRPAATMPDAVGSITAALARAVEQADDPVCVEGWGGAGATQPYLSGLVAMTRLVGDLEQLRGDGLHEFHALNPSRPDDGQFRGMHEELQHLRVLSDRRCAAQAFLGTAANICHFRSAAAAAALRAAATAYGSVGDLAAQTFELRHGSVIEADAAFAVLAAGFPKGEHDDAWSGYWQRADERLASASLRAQMVELLWRLIRREEDARGHLIDAVQHLQLIDTVHNGTESTLRPSMLWQEERPGVRRCQAGASCTARM